MRTFFVTLIVVFLIVTFPSCKKSNDLNPQEPFVEGVKVGNRAPNFVETDSHGNSISLDSFKGKVIVLSFGTMWSGYCHHIVDTLKHMDYMYQAQGLEVIQCMFQNEENNNCTMEDLQAWVDQFKIGYWVINDPDYSTVDTWNFNAIPISIVIDRQFIIRGIVKGNNISSLENIITGAL